MPDIDTTDLEITIKDLVDVEPRTYGTEDQVSEAATWLQFTAQTEDQVEEALGPSIKEAHEAHKALTGQRKSLLDLLISAKNRVRVNVANWIAGGHDVDGFYIKKKWRVKVKNIDDVPDEYIVTTVDQEKLEDWATKTEGQESIPGCEIEQVNILVPSPAKKEAKPKEERPAVKATAPPPIPKQEIHAVPKQFTMKTCRGTNVVGVGWIDGILRVAFAAPNPKSTEPAYSFWRYGNLDNKVPVEVRDKLARSPYPDKLFHQIVKGKYPAEKEA